jgi:hypothetical protein
MVLWEDLQRCTSSHLEDAWFNAFSWEFSFYTKATSTTAMISSQSTNDLPPMPTTRTHISSWQFRQPGQLRSTHICWYCKYRWATHLCGVLGFRCLWQLGGSKMKHVSYFTCIYFIGHRKVQRPTLKDKTQKERSKTRWPCCVIHYLGFGHWGDQILALLN